MTDVKKKTTRAKTTRTKSAPKTARPKSRKAAAAPSLDEPTRLILQSTWNILHEAKAVDPVVLDLRPYSSYCDFMVIASATSDRHMEAMKTRVEMELKKNQALFPSSVEGNSHTLWLLLDYGSVVVHLFQGDGRAFYDLEGFWNRASRLTPKDLKGL